MPPVYELAPGDVVVVAAGDVRTVARVEMLSTARSLLTRVHFTDGDTALLDAGSYVHRLYPPTLRVPTHPYLATKAAPTALTQRT